MGLSLVKSPAEEGSLALGGQTTATASFELTQADVSRCVIHNSTTVAHASTTAIRNDPIALFFN